MTGMPDSARGRFLVLEGVDGCGKSTQATRLVQRLQDRGRDVLHTREPGGTSVGERVRDILLDRASGHLVPMAEVFLYQAARAQLAQTVIGPALQAGQDVVCERWHYATSAYQGAAGGASQDAVNTTSRLATAGTEPDRALLLDLPEDVIEARLDRPQDRMEAKGAAYRARVAQHFRQTFATEEVSTDGTQRCRILSAVGSIDEVEARIWDAVASLFPEVASR